MSALRREIYWERNRNEKSIQDQPNFWGYKVRRLRGQIGEDEKWEREYYESPAVERRGRTRDGAYEPFVWAKRFGWRQVILDMAQRIGTDAGLVDAKWRMAHRKMRDMEAVHVALSQDLYPTAMASAKKWLGSSSGGDVER